jgi:hypothetical protein
MSALDMFTPAVAMADGLGLRRQGHDHISYDDPPQAANGPQARSDQGFYAIALSITAAEQGLWVYVITLMHHQSSLNIVLETSCCDEEIVAHWRAWGQKYHLPLAVERAMGVMLKLEHFIGDVKSATSPLQRRICAHTQRRRTHDCAQRRAGRRRSRSLCDWRRINTSAR